MSAPKITVTYVGGFAAHVRAMLLSSYLTWSGARHEQIDGDAWSMPVCPLCTYESADVLVGVPWPCERATP